MINADWREDIADASTFRRRCRRILDEADVQIMDALADVAATSLLQRAVARPARSIELLLQIRALAHTMIETDSRRRSVKIDSPVAIGAAALRVA